MVPDDDIVQQHRNPAIERMMAILVELEKNPGGLGLKSLVERTGVTRSTVYRILNSLEAHEFVRQIDDARYVLGSRLLSLADGVTTAHDSREIAKTAQPHLDALAARLGESCKVSVYDRGFVLVIATAAGNTPHSLHAPVGLHLPIHAGAGSKVLLAHLPEPEKSAILARALKKFTDMTLVEPAALRAELDKVRAQGWSRDHGEFSIAVNAYGAPILNRDGEVVGALSVPFLAGRDPDYEARVREAALATAVAIGADISGSVSPSPRPR